MGTVSILDPYDAYKIYHCLAWHFENKWDVEKYGYANKRLTQERFNRSPERFACQKATKAFDSKEQFISYLAGVLVLSSTTPWITELVNDKDKFWRLYNRREKYIRGIAYNFKEDVKRLLTLNTFAHHMENKDEITSWVLSEMMNPETVVIIEKCCPGFIEKDESKNLLWSELLKNRLAKYKMFVSVQQESDLVDCCRFLTEQITNETI